MIIEESYLICYKPKSYKGCHKQKLTRTYTEAIKFMNRVEKRGSIVICIYTPGGTKIYDRRWLNENFKNN